MLSHIFRLLFFFTKVVKFPKSSPNDTLHSSVLAYYKVCPLTLTELVTSMKIVFPISWRPRASYWYVKCIIFSIWVMNQICKQSWIKRVLSITSNLKYFSHRFQLEIWIFLSDTMLCISARSQRAICLASERFECFNLAMETRLQRY